MTELSPDSLKRAEEVITNDGSCQWRGCGCPWYVPAATGGGK